MNVEQESDIERDWISFPSIYIPRGSKLFRVHISKNHPIWFCNDSYHRFDPSESHNHLFGACYFGFEPLACLIEIFGKVVNITEEEINQRSLSVIQTKRSLRIADTTDRRVLGKFGLTAEISTGSDYKEPQRLSWQLFETGFDGIKYWIRHDPKMELEAIAIFGAPGEDHKRFNVLNTEPIPETLIATVDEFGLQVIPSAYLL